jgi:hypothetical protein
VNPEPVVLYAPDELAKKLKTAVVPFGRVSVHLTVAFGVAVPLMVNIVTPTVPLDGETVPVRFAVAGFTVRLTGGAELVTEPFCPRNVMLRAGVVAPAVVLMVNVVLACPPDGTFTVAGENDAVAPANSQSSAVGLIAPANPPTLVYVTT